MGVLWFTVGALLAVAWYLGRRRVRGRVVVLWCDEWRLGLQRDL